MKKLTVLALLLVVASCGNTKAFYDYNKKANFDNFKTFDFYDEMRSGLGQLDEDRLRNALRQGLQNKSFTQAEDPDFKVNFYVDTFKKGNSNTIGVGLGGGGGHMGGGVSGGIPLGGNKRYLSVTIEFTKASNDDLFWQAVVESPFHPAQSPEERETYFQEIVEKALKKYPPK